MAKTPLFTAFRAFHVFLYLQKHCKYQHFLWSTRQKCCNLQCFFFAFKNTGICSVLCISGPKSIGIYSIFCVFAWLPQKTVKRKNAVIYSILWLSKTEKSSEKCVKTALFSDFRTSKTHLQISPSFCPPQTPKNVKTPAPWRIFKKVGGTGAPPGS